MKKSKTTDVDLGVQQGALALKAMFELFEKNQLSKDQTNQLADATVDAVMAYHHMLLRGSINVRTVILLARNLSDTFVEQGFTHEEFLEYAKSFMRLGYHPGFFGIYLDYSLAARLGELD